jgi:hypothetical protein
MLNLYNNIPSTTHNTLLPAADTNAIVPVLVEGNRQLAKEISFTEIAAKSVSNLEQHDSVRFNDIITLTRHVGEHMDANLAIKDTALKIIKNPTVLSRPDWNDIHVIKALNESGVFVDAITQYKSHLSFVPKDFNFIINYSNASLEITKNLVRSIKLFEGTEGLQELSNILISIGIQNLDSEFKWYQCLKIYSILLYSAPYIFIKTGVDPLSLNVTQLYAPYELIANELQNLTLDVLNISLPSSMKWQAYLENNCISGLVLAKKMYALGVYLSDQIDHYKYHAVAVTIGLALIGTYKALRPISPSFKTLGPSLVAAAAITKEASIAKKKEVLEESHRLSECELIHTIFQMFFGW